MKTHEFALTLRSDPTEEQVNGIYSVIDDATLITTSGQSEFRFHREAVSLEDAMRSAIEDVTKAGLDVDHVQMETQAILG